MDVAGNIFIQIIVFFFSVSFLFFLIFLLAKQKGVRTVFLVLTLFWGILGIIHEIRIYTITKKGEKDIIGEYFINPTNSNIDSNRIGDFTDVYLHLKDDNTFFINKNIFLNKHGKTGVWGCYYKFGEVTDSEPLLKFKDGFTKKVLQYWRDSTITIYLPDSSGNTYRPEHWIVLKKKKN